MAGRERLRDIGLGATIGSVAGGAFGGIITVGQLMNEAQAWPGEATTPTGNLVRFMLGAVAAGAVLGAGVGVLEGRNLPSNEPDQQ